MKNIICHMLFSACVDTSTENDNLCLNNTDHHSVIVCVLFTRTRLSLTFTATVTDIFTRQAHIPDALSSLHIQLFLAC